MTSEVLYRKWRPSSFLDVVGQDPITRTLAQAVATNRISHAYLLCGPRGTGKTSTARILAKALNCTMRPPGIGDPCGACDACRSIERGNFIDLIEIDAASNRGIDEMRDLREKVRFSPNQGKFKVYIVDEAHQLTREAFNAFLKTLEEPPPHSVFVLATTESHRLPPTITSRCQRFDFHRISLDDIVNRLAEIASSESVQIEPEALRTISRTATGSLRDATNLLDQMITSFGHQITLEQVNGLLGIGSEKTATVLVKHLLTANTTSALEVINNARSDGVDLGQLHRFAIDSLRATLLVKSGVKDSIEWSEEASAELSSTITDTSIEHIMKALQLFSQIRLRSDQPSPLPLELAIVELGLSLDQTRQTNPTIPTTVNHQNTAKAFISRANSEAITPTVGTDASHQITNQTAPSFSVQNQSTPMEERLAMQWSSILRALGKVPRRRFDVAALLRSSTKREISDNVLIIRFSHSSNRERLETELEDARCRLEVERILTEALGEGVTLSIQSEQASGTTNPKEEQPGTLVRAALSLGGQIVESNPLEEPLDAELSTPSQTSTIPEPVESLTAPSTELATYEPLDKDYNTENSTDAIISGDDTAPRDREASNPTNHPNDDYAANLSLSASPSAGSADIPSATDANISHGLGSNTQPELANKEPVDE